MSISISVEDSCKLIKVFKLKENNIFAEIFLDAIIWDSSKKERNNLHSYSLDLYNFL